MIKEARPISITPKEKADFQQHGFFQLRGFLDKNDVNYYLERVNHILGLAKNHHLISTPDKVTHTMADGVTKNSQLWPLIFDPQLLKTVRYLVGEDIKYTQHSDIHVNLPAGRWHRDNALRKPTVSCELPSTYRVSPAVALRYWFCQAATQKRHLLIGRNMCCGTICAHWLERSK